MKEGWGAWSWVRGLRGVEGAADRGLRGVWGVFKGVDRGLRWRTYCRGIREKWSVGQGGGQWTLREEIRKLALHTFYAPPHGLAGQGFLRVQLGSGSLPNNEK